MKKDPKRIIEILNRLKVVWMSNPDLRLMQLLDNIPGDHKYYWEDHDAIKAAERFYFG